MESLNPKFALYDSKTKCTRTDIVFFPLSDVSGGVVYFTDGKGYSNNSIIHDVIMLSFVF